MAPGDSWCSGLSQPGNGPKHKSLGPHPCSLAWVLRGKTHPAPHVVTLPVGRQPLGQTRMQDTIPASTSLPSGSWEGLYRGPLPWRKVHKADCTPAWQTEDLGLSLGKLGPPLPSLLPAHWCPGAQGDGVLSAPSLAGQGAICTLLSAPWREARSLLQREGLGLFPGQQGPVAGRQGGGRGEGWGPAGGVPSPPQASGLKALP